MVLTPMLDVALTNMSTEKLFTTRPTTLYTESPKTGTKILTTINNGRTIPGTILTK